MKFKVKFLKCLSVLDMQSSELMRRSSFSLGMHTFPLFVGNQAFSFLLQDSPVCSDRKDSAAGFISCIKTRQERKICSKCQPVFPPVCHLLRTGVAALFGPESGTTSVHIQSICDAMEIPHIETRYNIVHILFQLRVMI